MANNDYKLPLKLIIDTKTNKVLFAEAGKDAVDFLFGLLALPVATIVKLLSKEEMVGCIGGLYTSVEQFKESYLLSSEKKSTLLNYHVFSSPTSKDTFLRPPETKKYYYCYSCAMSHCRLYVTDVSRTRCPGCCSDMTSPLKLVGSKEDGGVGFVKDVVNYSITDDLFVEPISSVTLLNKFQINDLGSLREENVKLGIEEGLELVKASLQSKKVLTTVFLEKKEESFAQKEKKEESAMQGLEVAN